MLTVYKYELPIDDTVDIVMPEGAELLSVGVQGGAAMLWARVLTSAKAERRRFRIAGTGHPDARGRYVGTVMLDGLVFHVFDLGATGGE